MGLLDQIVSSLGQTGQDKPANANTNADPNANASADANADASAKGGADANADSNAAGGAATAGAAGTGGVPGLLVSMLGHQEGGLGALVQKFNEAGAGNLISSWIGNGQNADVSPDRLHEILGSDLVQKLAAKTGLPVEQLLSELSQHLPAVVNAMTPNGQMPSRDQLLASGMSFLKSRLG